MEGTMSAIISDLVHLLEENRLIPFLGAGFSENCDFPSAQTLTNQLLHNFQLADYQSSGEEVELLHLAEYLKIVQGGSISRVLQQLRIILNDDAVDVSQSTPHLLLARLGVPIIYTTNYDRLIERSFDYLAIPYQTVVSTADIIKTTGGGDVQIVKFHGSLELDESIVLTESDYYERLEFVTPIDIKLRADSLGKSLLFMGYSFSDFNIRYLWFKLRKMMRGIDVHGLPNSYILLFKPDQITAELLKNMGIIPIDLSRYDGPTKSDQLSGFLRQLVHASK
jgi:hypothetical protein